MSSDVAAVPAGVIEGHSLQLTWVWKLGYRGYAHGSKGEQMTRIATFNVNGVNGRLPVLLKWLGQSNYDIVCLQELKTSDEKFPAEEIGKAGYGAIWHGQKSYNGAAILAQGTVPVERRRGLPGDPDDSHSRYIEAELNGLILSCLYLPNGNPAPGPKLDYKLRWFNCLRYRRRLSWRAASLRGHPAG